MDLPDDHANIDIVNRILDLLDALRKTEEIKGASMRSTGRDNIAEAFRKKIDLYKRKMNSPRVDE
jgi:hypothetical protein